MYVSRLSVTDFRSYEQADLALEPGVTVLVGSNGQGKTNLVEAVGYAATLESHRVAQAAPLVRIGATRAIVRVEVIRDQRPTLVELEINPGSATRGQLNRSRVPRARDVLGYVRTVLFAPEDLALVKGDPAERRAFLDTLMTARNPRMAGVRADYDRVLRQRNALLKTARQSRRPDPHFDSTLSVWDGQLAALGAEIVAARLELVELLGPQATSAYARVAPQGSARVVSMQYVSSLKDHLPATRDRESLLTAFAAAQQDRRREEVERGISLVGPHRDDLALSLGPAGAAPVPAKGFASHGESWSLALALKLASFWLLREDGHGEPVLILDDVFAELDAERRERLASVVADAEQVLITAAVLEDIPKALDGARCLVTLGSVSHV